MSWSCNMKGNRAEAIQSLGAEPHVPQEVLDAATVVMGLLGEDKQLQVSTHGHINRDTGTGNLVIDIKTV